MDTRYQIMYRIESKNHNIDKGNGLLTILKIVLLGLTVILVICPCHYNSECVYANDNDELKCNVATDDFCVKINDRVYNLYYSVTEKNEQESGEKYSLFIPACAEKEDIILSYIGKYEIKFSGEGVLDKKNNSCLLKFDQSMKNVMKVKAECAASCLNLIIELRLCSPEIPTVFLDSIENPEIMTEMESDPEHKKEIKGSLSILSDEDKNVIDVPMTIKGRGNASWKRAKKSFQITLSNRTNILGMGEGKKWILLSNTADITLLRNAVGFSVARELGIEYTPDYRYCNLFINGDYRGLYCICEKIIIDKERINISNLEKNVKEELKNTECEYLSEMVVDYSDDYKTCKLRNGLQIDLTGGYHLEMDNYEDECQFTTARYGLKITVKEPDNLAESVNDNAYEYIRAFINSVEEVLSKDNVSREELGAYIDIESFALMWLHTECLGQLDAAYNYHMWKESDITGDGLLHAGPPWDMDRSAGRNTQSLEDNDAIFRETITGDYETGEFAGYRWMDLLLKHDCFKEEIVRQYNLHKEMFSCCDCSCLSLSDENAILESSCGCMIKGFCDLNEEIIKESANNDMIRWTGSNNYKGGSSIAERNLGIAILKKFYCVRNIYLSNRIPLMANLYSVSFFDNGTECVIPIGKTGVKKLPLPHSTEGFIGWYYLNEEKEMVPFTNNFNVDKPMQVYALYEEKTWSSIFLFFVLLMTGLLITLVIKKITRRLNRNL